MTHNISSLPPSHSLMPHRRQWNPIFSDRKTSSQTTSTINFGEHAATALATVRKILSSPISCAKSEAWSLSITTGPGFARISCARTQGASGKAVFLISEHTHTHIYIHYRKWYVFVCCLRFIWCCNVAAVSKLGLDFIAY